MIRGAISRTVDAPCVAIVTLPNPRVALAGCGATQGGRGMRRRAAHAHAKCVREVEEVAAPEPVEEEVAAPSTPAQVESSCEEKEQTPPASAPRAVVAETPEDVRRHRAEVDRTRQRLISMGIISAPLKETASNKPVPGKLSQRLEVYAQAAARLEKAIKEATALSREVDEVLADPEGPLVDSWVEETLLPSEGRSPSWRS